MVRYLDLLRVKTYNTRKEIELLNDKLKEIELETTKEYFSIGSKVIYDDCFETITGIVIKVDDKSNVTIKDEECWVRIFRANDLNVIE